MREENTFVARKKIKTRFILSTLDIYELVIKIFSVKICFYSVFYQIICSNEIFLLKIF